MCSVSALGDQFGRQTLPQQYPWAVPNTGTIVLGGVSQAEFDKLKNEVTELRKLLLAAKAYDAATGQPDCEVDEKVALIRRVADLVGVDISDVFPEGE